MLLLKEEEHIRAVFFELNGVLLEKTPWLRYSHPCKKTHLDLWTHTPVTSKSTPVFSEASVSGL